MSNTATVRYTGKSHGHVFNGVAWCGEILDPPRSKRLMPVSVLRADSDNRAALSDIKSHLHDEAGRTGI